MQVNTFIGVVCKVTSPLFLLLPSLVLLVYVWSMRHVSCPAFCVDDSKCRTHPRVASGNQYARQRMKIDQRIAFPIETSHVPQFRMLIRVKNSREFILKRKNEKYYSREICTSHPIKGQILKFCVDILTQKNKKIASYYMIQADFKILIIKRLIFERFIYKRIIFLIRKAYF